MKLLTPLIEIDDALSLITTEGITMAMPTRPFESLGWLPLEEWIAFMEEGKIPSLDKVNPRYHWLIDSILLKDKNDLREAYNNCPLKIRDGLIGFYEITSWGAVIEQAPLEDMELMLELEEFHNLHLWVESKDGNYAEILDVCEITNLPRDSGEPITVEISHLTPFGKSVIALSGNLMAVVIKTEHARERDLLRGLEIVTSTI